MIEIKCLTHTTRLFSPRTSWLDFINPVVYFSYQGDIDKVPWYFTKSRGESAQTDLTLPFDQIASKMKSNTRNEVRRAEKEGCQFEIISDIKEFIPFYNSFCKSKGLNDFVDEKRLGKYKHLLIAKAMLSGRVLSMHATILDDVSKTAVLILSCSERLNEGIDRKLIGWANRFLHYKELEYLQSIGFALYDWSGVVTDKNSPVYSIGQFKLSFGGTLVDSWTLMSPIYRLLMSARSLIMRIRARKCR